jgi:hypothetical protein
MSSGRGCQPARGDHRATASERRRRHECRLMLPMGPRDDIRRRAPQDHDASRRGSVRASRRQPSSASRRQPSSASRRQPSSGPARAAPPQRPLTTTSRPCGRLVRRNRRRPTLPGPCEPSTIGAVGLNCSVRNGKRCFPHAIATGNCARPDAVPQNCTVFPQNGISIRQALDPLVPVSCECYHSSRSGLSTWWSTRGLTPSRGWESSSRGRLPA